MSWPKETANALRTLETCSRKIADNAYCRAVAVQILERPVCSEELQEGRHS